MTSALALAETTEHQVPASYPYLRVIPGGIRPGTCAPVDSAVDVYIEELWNFEVLSEEGEQGLARKARAGDAKAREALINANLRLVVSIAKKYRKGHTHFMDIVQEGNKGLLKAIDHFNPELGYRFSTYASFWIKSYVLKGVADSTPGVRLPAHRLSSLGRFRRRVQEEEKKVGRELTRDEIAGITGRGLDEVDQILHVARETLSFEENVGMIEGQLATTAAALAATETRPEAALTARALSAEVQRALMTLTEREQDILSLRFGLEDGESHSLEWIGQRYGITRERVRQLEARALAKLRASQETVSRLSEFYCE